MFDLPEASHPAPDAAAHLFAERAGLAARYAELLSRAGIERGLLGPREAERIWPRHIINSALVATWAPENASVVDVGSGAGLPGIPMVLARPDLTMTLLEPLARRVSFLELVRDALGLDLVVRRGRAESISDQFDLVVARAVAPLDRLAALCRPLLAPGGSLLAVKGARASEELSAAAASLRALRLSAEVLTTGIDGEAVHVVRLTEQNPATR